MLALDAADVRRWAPFSERLAEDAKILNVDHHPTNTRYGTVQLVIPEAAATAQLVYYLACALDVPLNEPLATCLYTGIMTDTGGFRYSNTNPEVMRIAATLLAAGADPSKSGRTVSRADQCLPAGIVAAGFGSPAAGDGRTIGLDVCDPAGF